MATGVLVFGEATEEGKLAPVVAELLAAGSRLGQPVVCALLGSGVESLAQECVAQGADKVIVVDDPVLGDHQADAWLPVAERICEESDAAIVLIGQTTVGREMAPRLAQRLGTAVAMDCVALGVEGDRMVAERPCYGGNARARYTMDSTPQMATVRAKAQDPLDRDDSRQGEIVNKEAGVSSDQVRTSVVSRRKEKVEGVRLEDAAVVVGGGRGLGGPEGFKSLEGLAEMLGGAVGASRAACDLGWYPVGAQIGLTGKVVTPNLYIAVGISGASQHMAGVSGVKSVVSINRDPEAGIFQASRFAVVGDWNEIIPPLAEKVRQLKAS